VTDPKQQSFDVEDFLASAGLGRSIVQLKAREAFFSQGSEADSIFYPQKGRAKLTVVSAAGKEATLTLLVAGDFVRLREPWDAGWRLPQPSALVPPTK
jgi:CRP/FNR family transcriptional regulator, cyclic AMP receptor protein